MTLTYTESQQAIIDLFEKHVNAELAGDLETTMATMTETPHINSVPSHVGGYGAEGVLAFYTNHLVGKFFPPDVQMERISLTVDENQLVEEHVIRFTHTAVIDWMLPGIEPTGKFVEVGFVVIVGVKEGKVSHEHIYWDQACVLVQLGLLSRDGLPVCGAESAQRLTDPSRPSRTMI